MDELDNNKLKAEDDGREVESEENQRGEEIEVNEDRLPSRAMAIHEHIRQEGEKEMERDALALLWSAIAAGLSMGASLLAKGIFHVKLEGIPGGFLLENLGYTFGFIIVIMARQQLKKLEGVLKDANEENFTVTIEKKVKPEGAKRPKLVEENITFAYDEIKYTKYLISFK